MQQQLSSLHGPDVVKRWLTIMRKGRLHFDSRIESGHSPQESIVPSYNAALLLILPSILLNWSSIALLIGIGIYYGIVHAEKLSSVRGEHSSLAILLVYVLFTLGASLSYVLPWSQKLLESTTPAQSAPEQSSKDEPGDAPLFTTRSETADSGQTNHNGHSMRFDLLRTGGMRKAGHHDFTQDGSLGAQRNAVHVPTMRRRHSLPPHQSHGGTKSNSNNPQTRT